MTSEYEGSIVEIIFHNEENGYTVAVFETGEDYFTIVGNIFSVSVGKSYQIEGEFVNHKTYGQQFAISRYEEIMPSTKDGIRDFLSSGAIKGIGSKTASAIVSRFGEDTLDIIENHPERLTEVSGIGEKTAAKVAEAYNTHREYADVALKLSALGISANVSVKLYQTFGADAVEVIKENPYQLVDEVFGIGFRRADKIAEKIGIKKDDPFRIQSGIRFTLSYHSGEGHTFLPQKELCEKAAQLLDLTSVQVEEELQTLAFAGDIRLDLLEGQKVVYLMPFYVAEQNVCKSLRLLNSTPIKPIAGNVESLIMRTEVETGILLSEKQKQAVINSLNMGVTVITGGPGTGKTTIINTIINILQASGLETAIAAPTGRAAKRITETSGHHASTIHRLLEYSFYERDTGDGAETDGTRFMRFGRNEENPLECDAVVIDEASMIDLLLMNGLLKAIRPGTRLIIVGDDDQLPSVGAGNVLRDIIASEYVYCTKLTEIFRQAEESMIVVNAHRINKGEYPACNAKDKDFFLMRRRTEIEMLETIKELCLKRLPDYYEDIEPLRDLQVLTPVRKGTLGCINMNVVLQEAMNPPSEEKEEKKYGDKVFREGDKVMQIRNNYELTWKNLEDFTDGEGVFNGDVGFIQSIDQEFHEVVAVFDENRYVTYDFNQLDELELAYAITVHKSQGSEFPIVIMPISWFPPMLATRNLLYTGVTRGKRVVVLVGSENKLNAMVDNNRISLRYSGLQTRLRRLMELDGQQG